MKMNKSLIGLASCVASFKSVSSDLEIILDCKGTEYKITSETENLGPVDSSAALEVVKKGHSSVNIWFEPNKTEVKFMSVNYK